eukprot:m.84342 g.84342  ORF g.84342 m.84342 type:complete len:843 (+) comp14801_c0_seq1:479-3007(+)
MAATQAYGQALHTCLVRHDKAGPLKLSFPPDRSVLWARTRAGPDVVLGAHAAIVTNPQTLALMRDDLVLKAAALDADTLPQPSCFLIGSLSRTESSWTVRLDRYDPGAATDNGLVPTVRIPGDIVVPVAARVFEAGYDASAVETAPPSLPPQQVCSLCDELHRWCCADGPIDAAQLLPVAASCCVTPAGAMNLRWCVVQSSTNFKATPIPAVPILDTALARKLNGHASQVLPAPLEPEFGYLTMDATRKIVPVLHNEPKLSSIPIVGVWLTAVASISEPFCWASCLRFIHNNTITDRAVMASGSFLVALFTPNSRTVQCFDVTPLEVEASPFEFSVATSCLPSPSEVGPSTTFSTSYFVEPEPLTEGAELASFLSSLGDDDDGSCVEPETPFQTETPGDGLLNTHEALPTANTLDQSGHDEESLLLPNAEAAEDDAPTQVALATCSVAVQTDAESVEHEPTVQALWAQVQALQLQLQQVLESQQGPQQASQPAQPRETPSLVDASSPVQELVAAAPAMTVTPSTPEGVQRKQSIDSLGGAFSVEPMDARDLGASLSGIDSIAPSPVSNWEQCDQAQSGGQGDRPHADEITDHTVDQEGSHNNGKAGSLRTAEQRLMNALLSAHDVSSVSSNLDLSGLDTALPASPRLLTPLDGRACPRLIPDSATSDEGRALLVVSPILFDEPKVAAGHVQQLVPEDIKSPSPQKGTVFSFSEAFQPNSGTVWQIPPSRQASSETSAGSAPVPEQRLRNTTNHSPRAQQPLVTCSISFVERQADALAQKYLGSDTAASDMARFGNQGDENAAFSIDTRQYLQRHRLVTDGAPPPSTGRVLDMQRIQSLPKFV